MSKVTVTPLVTDTRTRLLQAAHCLIWQSSYSGVSVDDICGRAGVNKGSFYHFFPSKNALAIAALQDHWASMLPEFEKILHAQISPVLKIKGLVQFMYKQQKEKYEEIGQVCGCPYASLGSEISMQDEALRNAVQSKLDKAVEFLEMLLHEATALKLIDGNQITEKARTMDIFIIGLLTTARIQNSLEHFEKDLESGLLRIAGLS